MRELRNAAERLVILLVGDTVTEREIIELDIGATSLSDTSGYELYHEKGIRKTSRSNSEELYRQFLESGLSREEFAKSIGMSRTTLWRKLAQFS